jgi:hypothetical protein
MGQGNTVPDARAVELLTFLQRAQQRLPGFRAAGELRDSANQFNEHLVSLAAGQSQFNGRDGNQVADEHPVWIRCCHRRISASGPWQVQGKCSPLPSPMENR